MMFYPRGVQVVALAGGVLITFFSYRFALVGPAVFIVVWILSVVAIIRRFTSTNPSRHWRAFNILARLLGLGASAVGGAASSELPLVGAIGVAFGLLVLALPSYRPDLGDAATSDRTMRLLWGFPSNWQSPRAEGQRCRRWWTGDP